jgi:hypothetical protein
MRSKSILIFFAIHLFFYSYQVNATNFNLVGGLAIPSASNTPSSTYVSTPLAMAYGGGILIDFNMVPKLLAFEWGVLYMPRGYQYSFSGGSSTTLTLTTLQIPAVFRIYVLPAISIGIGGYYSYGIGNIGVSTAGSSSTLPYGTGSLSNGDYGFLASLGIKIPLGGSWLSLIADGRYLYGLSNVNQQTVPPFPKAINLQDFQVLVGIRLGR